MSQHPRVAFGVDRVVNFPGVLPRGRRVGLLTNHAARLARDSRIPGRTALLDAGVDLVRLFSPEHGLRASAADGHGVGDATDRETGLPIVSLYGDRFAPPPEALADLDYLLVDLPDVGARFYTYVWTLSHVLEACAHTRTRVVVLDRPNPLGGKLEAAEGPMLDEETCASFIGRWSIPVRHSLTLGELAYHWSKTRLTGVEVDVVRAHGWRREMHWPSLGLPWIATSPSMPSYASALTYPGTCLFEATNLSVGRGTELPFQVIAAPWLEPRRVIEQVEGAAWLGARLLPDEVVPSMEPHMGVRSPAVRIEVVDPARFRPVAVGLALLAAVVRSEHHHFAWATYPTAANPTGRGHFERLVGRRGIKERLEGRAAAISADDIARWTTVRSWHEDVAPHLLYD